MPLIAEGMTDFAITDAERDKLLAAGLICEGTGPEAPADVFMLTNEALDKYDADDPENATLLMLKEHGMTRGST